MPRILAQGLAGFKIGTELFEQGSFVGAVLVELLPLILRDGVEARFDEAEIADGKFEIDLVDISQGIDAAFGVEHGRIFEGADDMAECVHVLEFVQPLLARLGFVGWGGGKRDFDLGVLGLLRIVHRGEFVDARVGNFDVADVELGGAALQVVETDAGHQREDGLLADLRQTDERDFHTFVGQGSCLSVWGIKLEAGSTVSN